MIGWPLGQRHEEGDAKVFPDRPVVNHGANLRTPFREFQYGKRTRKGKRRVGVKKAAVGLLLTFGAVGWHLYSGCRKGALLAGSSGG